MYFQSIGIRIEEITDEVATTTCEMKQASSSESCDHVSKQASSGGVLPTNSEHLQDKESIRFVCLTHDMTQKFQLFLLNKDLNTLLIHIIQSSVHPNRWNVDWTHSRSLILQ